MHMSEFSSDMKMADLVESNYRLLGVLSRLGLDADFGEKTVGEMCGNCGKAAKCLGGCREAARAFSGSPTAPDPLFAMGK